MLSAEGPAPSGGGAGIGVGPVNLPEYIDRNNLVLQTGPNRLEVAEDHRWAGDLAGSIARVTSINLGRRLATGNVRTYPWQRDDEISNQVTIDIRQFHAGEDGHVLLEAGWRVFALPERNLRASKTFVDREPVNDESYEAVVAAKSRLLGRLSEDISQGIRRR